MKSSAHRDAMVGRVKAAHAKWPSFDKMPVSADTGDGFVTVPVKNVEDGTSYVEALYEVARVADIVGRREKAALIVGKLPAEAKKKA